MPLRSYGVLVARPVGVRREGGTDTPHYQIHAVTRAADGVGGARGALGPGDVPDATATDLRVAVNVMSAQSPPDLLYLVDDDFDHPVLADLPRASLGWLALPPGPGGPNLDFVRGNLFAREAMRQLPADADGPDNDLADLLDHYVTRAVADPGGRVYAFGERWPAEATVPDKIFGFLPGNGVHDIHMNQGNNGRFVRDDGVWQDGGLLLHLPGQDRWVAIFLAFQSQAWHTDDATGHALGGAGGGGGGDQPLAAGDGRVRIVAATVNPAGPAPEAETVTLLNASPEPVDLAGWRLADRMKRTCPAGAGAVLPAGAAMTVALTGGVQLGNSGGILTVLDAAGLKVDGVAYSQEQAAREGWSVVF